MSKPIRLSDDTYTRLKALSTRERRTLDGQVSYMLDAIGVSGPVGKITSPVLVAPPEKTENPKPATTGATATSDLFNRAEGYCKNGHPLTPQGRCLQKGCKWANKSIA